MRLGTGRLERGACSSAAKPTAQWPVDRSSSKKIHPSSSHSAPPPPPSPCSRVYISFFGRHAPSNGRSAVLVRELEWLWQLVGLDARVQQKPAFPGPNSQHEGMQHFRLCCYSSAQLCMLYGLVCGDALRGAAWLIELIRCTSALALLPIGALYSQRCKDVNTGASAGGLPCELS